MARLKPESFGSDEHYFEAMESKFDAQPLAATDDAVRRHRILTPWRHEN